MNKKFYSSHCFSKNQIFSLFLIVKMNPNYTEICWVGNLEADFQKVLLVQFFQNVHTSSNIINLLSVELAQRVVNIIAAELLCF